MLLIILQVLFHCVQGGSALLEQLSTQQGKGFFFVVLEQLIVVAILVSEQFKAFCSAGSLSDSHSSHGKQSCEVVPQPGKR